MQWGGDDADDGATPTTDDVPADCLACFDACAPGEECAACARALQGPCTATCAPEGVPFDVLEEAVCGGADEPQPRRRAAATSDVWIGGQWLIPEIQNETTGWGSVGPNANH